MNEVPTPKQKPPGVWPRGLTSKHARKAGIGYRHFVSILERRRRVDPALARKLADITGVPLEDWMDPRYAKHPVFRGPTLCETARDYWCPGAITDAAIAAGISQGLLSNIIYRKRRCEPRLALKLQTATGIEAIEFATNRISNHPAFYGAPWENY